MKEQYPEMLPDWFAALLVEDEPPPDATTPPQPRPPTDLSLGELEVLVKEKRRAANLDTLRGVRTRIGGTGALTEPPIDPPPPFPLPPIAMPFPDPIETVTITRTPAPHAADDAKRFRTAMVAPVATPKAVPERVQPTSGLGDKVLLALEIVLIVLVLGVLVYIGLNALGVSVDGLFGGTTSATAPNAHGDGRTVSIIAGRPLAIVAPADNATIVAQKPTPDTAPALPTFPAEPTDTAGPLTPTATAVLPTAAGTSAAFASVPEHSHLPTSTPAAVPPSQTAATPPTAATQTFLRSPAPRPSPTPVSTPVIVAPAPPQTAAPGNPLDLPATRLVIPKIGVDTPVKDVTVDLAKWQVADYAAGHHRGTANPGETGNMVIAGHRDIRGSVFMRLPDLVPGDQVYFYTDAGRYVYTITDTFIVLPTDISVMDYTDEPTATLITCTPVALATKRFIVRGRLTETPAGH